MPKVIRAGIAAVMLGVLEGLLVAQVDVPDVLFWGGCCCSWSGAAGRCACGRPAIGAGWLTDSWRLLSRRFGRVPRIGTPDRQIRSLMAAGS
jgi:hypothetical protein